MISSRERTLGGSNSSAYAINSTSVIAGAATNSSVEGRPVTWLNEEITELGMDFAFSGGAAYDINDSGVVVGEARVPPYIYVPAMWIDGAFQKLPQLPEEANGTAWAVNEAGVAVGWTRPSEMESIATLWHEGEVYDLNDLIDDEDVFLYIAWDINDSGQITGLASDVDDVRRAFLLTPKAKVGDINGDGVVDVLDLLLVLAAWGPCGNDCPADVNGDGTVDVLDLLEILSHWG